MPARPRFVMRDDHAPHQIRVFFAGGGRRLAVSCTCRKRRTAGADIGYEPIETWQGTVDTDTIQRVWRNWHTFTGRDLG